MQMAACGEEGSILSFLDRGGGISGTSDSIWAAKPGGTVLRPVCCGRINRTLQMLRAKHIDLFSLDVEGAKFQVLSIIDFALVDISVLLVDVGALGNARADATAAETEKITKPVHANGFKRDQRCAAHNMVFVRSQNQTFPPSDSKTGATSTKKAGATTAPPAVVLAVGMELTIVMLIKSHLTAVR